MSLWFLARSKHNGRFRDRRGETLFIDAHKMGTMIDRVHRELTDEDIAKVAGTYHAWRGEDDGEPFDEKMKRLASALREQQREAHALDQTIALNLRELGYDE